MWNTEKVMQWFETTGVHGKVWGRRGSGVIQQLESDLNIAFDRELRAFACDVGNLMVSPFEIVLAGDESGQFSIVTETRALWRKFPHLEAERAVQIMEHAGQLYLSFSSDGRVCAYDSVRPFRGEETREWRTFSEFVAWAFQKAEAMK